MRNQRMKWIIEKNLKKNYDLKNNNHLMNFVTKEIKPKIIWIIDIWAYKIRVWICKIINRDVELVWYWEKRQDEQYILMQEFQNLEWISENIKEAIKKAELDWGIEVNDVIINIPTTNVFFEFSKINHIRENTKKEIWDKELYELMKLVESQALHKHYKTIKNNSWYKKNDLKLLISNISNIQIDNESTKDLNWTNPKKINISLLNIFIPESKFETVKYIEKAIKKNIVNIIPSEFAITWLFKDTEDIIIIDLWNSHTSVIVKKNNNIKGAKKLSFWINDLIKQIRNNYNLTKNDIIKTIDDDRFWAEKIEFLNIFKDILVITLEEILWDKICPSDFFILGWWANMFVKNYLKNIDFSWTDIKMAWKISFVSPNIEFLDLKIEDNPDWAYWAKSNINIFAMIQTTLDFIKKDKNKIEKILKEVIHDLES